MTILDEIIETKKREIDLLKKKNPLSPIVNVKGNNSFLRNVKKDGQNAFHLICEVKKASPSKGIIRENFQPVEIAKKYEQGGASAISVLTDEKYFMGRPEYLREIKKIVSLPVLRKDFIIDEYQIIESKIWHADIILLIAKVLDKIQLADYINIAAELKMDVLLELSEQDELEKLSSSYDNVIFGINNRNLHNFSVDINKSLKIKKLLPANVPIISESGIKTNDDCKRLYDAGFSGALVGETLMRSDDIGAEIQKLKTGL